MKKSLFIIVPVKNEEKHIEKTAREIISFCKTQFESHIIVFIDDKSTDKTLSKLSGIPNILSFRNKFDGGKGSALKTAYILSESLLKVKNDWLIVFMDGDGQIDPREISTFLNLMNIYQSDVVVGNKRHQYSNIRYSFLRTIISHGYNLIARILFGLNLRDTQCGLKIFTKEALDSVIEKVSIKRYAFDLELLVAMKEKYFRIIDAPVNIRQQINSGSVSLKNIAQTFVDTIIVWIKKLSGYYK